MTPLISKFLTHLLLMFWPQYVAVAFTAASGGAGGTNHGRQFNGTSDYLNSPSLSSLAGKTQVSLSFWMYWNTFANNDSLAFETSSNYNSNSGAFIVDPNSSAGNFEFSVFVGGGSYLSCTMSRPTAAAWHQYVLAWDTGAGTCQAYIDAFFQAVATTSQTGTFTTQPMYIMSRAGSSLFAGGRISAISIFSGILTPLDAANLAGCNAPTTISDATLLYYWPINQTSPEVPTTGSGNLTVNGTSNVASQCNFSTGGGGNSPYVSMYTPNLGGTLANGSQITATSLNAGTVCGGSATWTLGTPSNSTLTSTAAAMSLPVTTPTICQATYAAGAGTQGLEDNYNTPGGSGSLYSWDSPSETASFGVFVYTAIPTSDTLYYPGISIGNTAGTDFADLMTQGGMMYLETQGNPNGNPDTGAKYGYTVNSWYFVTIGYGVSAHSLSIYACSGTVTGSPPTLSCSGSWTIVAGSPMTKASIGSTSPPNHLSIGTGDTGNANYYLFDNLMVDFNGHFPLTTQLTGGQ
jgi:hypothetical protein